MKTRNKFNVQYFIEQSTLFATKIIIESDNFIPFRYNKYSKKTEMMLLGDEVANTFLEMSSFGLFLLFRDVLEKYVWYKSCSSDFALSNKKKFYWS
jgi:hypothetical protein